MTLTERQVRQRLAKAIEAAGGQKAIAETMPMPLGAARTAISKSLGGRQATHPLVLAYLGLRRDPRTGGIRDDAPPASSFQFIAVQASGEAGVAAAVALAAAALGRDS
ncbi:hypothetical protein [Methylobacterium aquaticum]|uniref:hypothetical protein n=1 Tax=Methylobacterium aquaticum TaxID=270351 RepID=UPI00193445F6|nr:hypothetical protein [Methylobacterium aquaticum]QRE76801.1 helix-turn-helix domain-containing protein [Methylobacterium aquaticum]